MKQIEYQSQDLFQMNKIKSRIKAVQKLLIDSDSKDSTLELTKELNSLYYRLNLVEGGYNV